MRTEEEFLHDLADALNRRRGEISNTRRVVHQFRDNVLEQTAARMAIPILYAQWEGFVKESLQDYIRFMEERDIQESRLHPSLLAYSWLPLARRLAGGLNFDKQTHIVLRALQVQERVAEFAAEEREINTESNLGFAVLEKLSKWFNIDIAPLHDKGKPLDALVGRRNNIAHGEQPQKIVAEDIDDLASFVLDILERFEGVLIDAVSTASYMREVSHV